MVLAVGERTILGEKSIEVQFNSTIPNVKVERAGHKMLESTIDALI